MIRRLVLLLVGCVLTTSVVFSQGLTTKATKDDWEEINFEFNSSILSDGYPSLLRLAELLQKNPGYKVKVEGHTDFVGSDAYNERLAMARANTIRDFLLKYGTPANQIEVSGQGKRSPEVDNRTKEGRFINRRVMLTVTDAQGKVVSAGGVGAAIQAMEPTKKVEDCCADILKKLDDILAALRDLKGENDKLKQEIADLKARPTPPPPPKGLEKSDVEQVVQSALDKSIPKPDRRFSLLGLNIGPDTTGNVTFTGKGRFFAPFGGTHAVQAEGEYLHYFDRKEGQFDIGLVNRWSNVQAGLFSSFKHVSLRGFQQGGTLGQGALTFDYVLPRGRIGFFGTKGFRNNVVINRALSTLSRNIFEETYLGIVDQIGGSTQVGLYGDAYIEGNFGALFRHGGSNRPGGLVRFVHPINELWAFTVEASLNETLVGGNDRGRVVFGVQLGNWLRPKEFREVTHPVPVDVPRVRYELLTRKVRTGNDPPVADAGPDQLGVQAGTIRLDGSNSFDPDGDPITFQWQQISGPSVSLSGANTAVATFTAAADQTYTFRLTVKDNFGGQGVDRVTVSTVRPPEVKIVRFTANPSSIRAGQTVTIVWEILNADEAEITGLGRVDPKSGTSTVAPTETTMYRLTARNRTSEVSETITVTVERPDPRFVRCEARPTNISPGEASTLVWETENADQVSITGIGNVRPSGTASVSPTQTATFVLTASNRFSSTSCSVTVVVGPPQRPRIIRFAAVPPSILPTEKSTLVWEVENATDVTITGIGTVQLTGTSEVSPADTATYTLVARNAQGEVSATAVVEVIRKVKILDFTADPPASLRPRAPVTLRWRTENATEVVITGIGSVPVNGTVIVNPSVATTYTLIAYGKRSQASAFIIVKIIGPNRPPVADAGPDFITFSSEVILDGSKSSDPDGDPITYSWRAVSGRAEFVTGANTARPHVRLLDGRGLYTFELTVTDDKGASSTDTVTVNFGDP